MHSPFDPYASDKNTNRFLILLGFNTGFNVAESTNFAVPEWLPFGQQARICLCHPHSVRIDMQQFQTLLDNYQDDMLERQEKGEEPLSYSEWANTHKKKRKKSSGNEMSDGTHHHSKTWVVEIMELAARKETTKIAPKKKKKKKTQKEEPKFRVAKPMTMSRFLLQTPVICILDCENGNEGYFVGTIVDVVDGHYAKIHFRRSKRTEDIWLSMDSGQLFLDGGLHDDDDDYDSE